MAQQRLFPSFFLGGFECSSHIDRSRQRRDFVRLTQHDRFFREDYERARNAGIYTIREGLRWYLCERNGRYDFSSIAPMVDTAVELGMTQINCLLHYGYPIDLDPLQPAFQERFAAFGAAYAEWRKARVPGPRWYGVVNEISLFSHVAGSEAWFAPFFTDRAQELKVALVKAAIAATDAIRRADGDAYFVSIDPATHVVSSSDDEAHRREVEARIGGQFEAWDMALGLMRPELGGGPEYVDVIGINHYFDTQRDLRTGTPLALDDPRRKPLRDILGDVYARYHRPLIMAETSARGERRPQWLRYLVDECLAAIEAGVDLQGICLYPLVDMPEWELGEIGPKAHLGLWETRKSSHGVLERIPYEPYLETLRAMHARLAKLDLFAPYNPAVWQKGRS